MFRCGPNPLSAALITTLEVSTSPTSNPTTVIHPVRPKLEPLVANVCFLKGKVRVSAVAIFMSDVANCACILCLVIYTLPQ